MHHRTAQRSLLVTLLIGGLACSSSGSIGGGTGGSPGSGGANSTGGSTGGSSSGGSPGTGGTISGTGGVATGGSHATGGTTGTGGIPATGGTSGSGGTAGGAGGRAGSSGGGGRGGAPSGGGTTGATGGSGGAGTTPSGMSAGCGTTPTIASSDYNNGHHIAITAAGKAREYILNVPTNYDNTKPYKLIIAYHELNGNDDEMYRNQYYHLMPLDTNKTTIFVAPNGQQNGANCTQASGCGWPNTSDSDMALADAVVAQVEQNFCVDTNHIYATGWSYGASMSEQTACERPLENAATNKWGVRAIAVYSVAYLSNTTNCKASKPVAYYASHGTQDTVLQYSGGVSIAQTWAAVDGCTAQTPTQATGSHVCTNYAGCMTGYPVEFCSFVGPHTPDPTDSGQRTSWEYQNVWTFLSQF